MAKSKSADKKSTKPAPALKNGGGKVAKPSETPKAAAKSMAKAAVTTVSKKGKEAKKPVKQPEPESDEDMDSDASESNSGSEDSGSSSGSEESEAEVKPKTNGHAKKATNGSSKKAESSSEEDGSESSGSEESDEEEEKLPTAKAGKSTQVAKAAEKDDESEDDSAEDDSEEDSEDDQAAKTKQTNGTNGTKKHEAEDDDDDDSSDDSSDEEEEAKPAQKKRKAETDADPSAKKTKTDEPAASGGVKTLFVGNLSWNVSEDMLHEEFSSFGELVGVRIVTSEGRSKGFGYIDFVEPSSAAAAHKAKKGAMLDGREMNIDFANARPERTANDRSQSFQNRSNAHGDRVGNPTDTLFLGNLSFNTTNEQLHEAFSEYGTVVRVSLPTDRETGAPKGFGYVSFTSVDEAKGALDALHGQDFNDRPIRMDYAQPRPEGGSFGGRGGGGRGGGGFRGNDRGRGGFRGNDRGGRGGGRGRGAPRGGRGGTTNRGGFGDFSGSKTTF